MKFLVIAALAATAVAAPQHGYGHDDHYARPYAFDYAVKNDYGGAFSQQEYSNGNDVQGQYSVQSEGGSTHVTYGGYAKAAPAYKAAPVHHAPAYKAAPVHHAPAYKAAPVYHAPAYKAAPVYHAPAYKAAPVYHAPAYKAAPVYHAPAYKAAPVYHAPAPVYHAPVHKVAPVYHAPAPVYHPALVHKSHGVTYHN